MGLHDTSTANVVLDGWLGTTRAAGSPDSYVIRLWIDHPKLVVSPREADWGGYTAPEWDSDDWLPADATAKSTDGLVDFGAPTSAGTAPAKWWGLHRTDTDALVYSTSLAAPINVAAESVNPVQIRPTVTAPIT